MNVDRLIILKKQEILNQYETTYLSWEILVVKRKRYEGEKVEVSEQVATKRLSTRSSNLPCNCEYMVHFRESNLSEKRWREREKESAWVGIAGYRVAPRSSERSIFIINSISLFEQWCYRSHRFLIYHWIHLLSSCFVLNLFRCSPPTSTTQSTRPKIKNSLCWTRFWARTRYER